MSKQTLLFIVIWATLSAANAFGQELPSLTVSQEGGFYTDSVSISLTSAALADIFYTLDGTRPTSKSPRYKKPITIKKTAVLRAVAIASQGKSIPYTHTYFINKIPSNFPTVSISVSPSLLFGEQQGIMQKGFQPTSGWMQYGANFWKKKEIVPNVEIFERDGQCVYNNLSGLRIFGGMSRTFPQKSMVITARKQYGQKYIKHRLFGKA